MKHLPQLFFSTVVALSLASCAAPGGGGEAAGTESNLGPHSAQKLVLVSHTGARHLAENDPNYVERLALIVKVQQLMTKTGQEITATAEARNGGPGGKLVGVDGLQVHVTAPVDFSTQPRKAGEAHITKTIPAKNGKFQTVTASATINSADFTNGVATVTVPGDQ